MIIHFFRVAIAAVALAALVMLGRSLWLRIHSEERVAISGSPKTEIEAEHVARYEFAKQFCAGKRVADIACGSGYGMKILREVARSVEGYDRERLGQRYVIDLEKQSWPETYDVIVSFETIEHLENPEFFLANAARSAPLLILSTPLNERLGWSTPYHKQAWTKEHIASLLERFFSCSYYNQRGTSITPAPALDSRCLVAVCVAKG